MNPAKDRFYRYIQYILTNKMQLQQKSLCGGADPLNHLQDFLRRDFVALSLVSLQTGQGFV